MVVLSEPSEATVPEFAHSSNELPELITAVTYWSTAVAKHDKNIPSWKVKTFQEELFHGLKRRCEGHWYPENPERGQGYRALICAERVDTLLLNALKKAQLTSLDLRQICGEEVVMYVDPGNVSVRLFPPYARGRRDITQTLFSNTSTSPSSNSSSSPPTNSPTTSSLNLHTNIHRPIVQLA